MKKLLYLVFLISAGVMAQVGSNAIIPVPSTPTNCTSTLPLQIVQNTSSVYGTDGSGGCTAIGGGGGAGVSSFNTRTGAVVPITGDYTPLQIGAVPAGGYYAGTATGLVNVLAATLPAGLGTPTQAQLIGIPITFTANLTSTNTTPTLNVNGLGAVTITKCNNTALIAGDITTTSPAQVIYSGTNYQVQNPQVGICQNNTSGSFQINGTASSGTFAPLSTTTNVLFGSPGGSSASQLSTATVQGAPNSGTGQGGNAFIKGGPNTDGILGIQGFAQIQQSFTTATALSATFMAVAMTTTADQVGASPTGSFTNAGVAQTVGGTNVQLFVVTNGKTTARFDGTPVIGDMVCYPLSGGTAGLFHDNGSAACALGENAGVVTGQVSGTGSGATATILIH